MDLTGKVAIVTGASSGIGAATVKALLNIGMKVVGFARRKEKIESLQDGHSGKLFALCVDVTKSQELIDAIGWVTKNVGPVHVLVNNAGILKQSSVITGDSETWKQIIDTNFTSVAISCKEVVKIMKEHEIDGYIINIDSVVGYYDTWNPKHVMYRSSKSALMTMTETVRIELARMKSKIRITSLSPGMVKTEIMEQSGYKKQNMEKILNRTPHLLGEDIASTIVYLLSTPQHVHISELLVRPTGEDLLTTSMEV